MKITDKNKALEAVKQNGWALEFASEELKNDKEVVLAAVWENGRALKYAGKEFRKDIKAVKEALLYLKIQKLCGQLRKQDFEQKVNDY